MEEEGKEEEEEEEEGQLMEIRFVPPTADLCKKAAVSYEFVATD